MKYILVFTFALGVLPNILAAGENDIGALAKEISNNGVALFERETHSPDDYKKALWLFEKSDETIKKSSGDKTLLYENAYYMGMIYYTGGYGVDKDEEKAKKLLKFSADNDNDNAKSFLKSIDDKIDYYKTCSLKEVLSYVNPIRNISETRYTFLPPESADLAYAKENNKEFSYDKSLKVQPDKKRYHLVNIMAIWELAGTTPDPLEPIIAVDPMQGNRFFCSGKVDIFADGARVEGRAENDPEYNYEDFFNYRYMGALPNGVHVLSCYEGMGGTGRMSYIMFLVFEKIKMLDYSDVTGKIILRTLGKIHIDSPKFYSSHLKCELKNGAFYIEYLSDDGGTNGYTQLYKNKIEIKF